MWVSAASCGSLEGRIYLPVAADNDSVNGRSMKRSLLSVVVSRGLLCSLSSKIVSRYCLHVPAGTSGKIDDHVVRTDRE